MSSYHGSKLSGSHSFLAETVICIFERWKEIVGTVLFLSAIITGKSYMSIFYVFSVIFAGPRFVERQ